MSHKFSHLGSRNTGSSQSDLTSCKFGSGNTLNPNKIISAALLQSTKDRVSVLLPHLQVVKLDTRLTIHRFDSQALERLLLWDQKSLRWRQTLCMMFVDTSGNLLWCVCVCQQHHHATKKNIYAKADNDYCARQNKLKSPTAHVEDPLPGHVLCRLHGEPWLGSSSTADPCLAAVPSRKWISHSLSRVPPQHLHIVLAANIPAGGINSNQQAVPR